MSLSLPWTDNILSQALLTLANLVSVPPAEAADTALAKSSGRF